MVSAGPHHTQIGAGGKSGSVQAGTCTGDLDLHDRDKFTQTTMVSPSRREEWLNQKSNVNPLRLSGRKKGGWDILRDVKKRSSKGHEQNLKSQRNTVQAGK